MTIAQLKKLAVEVFGGSVSIGHGKGGYWYDQQVYFVNVYGPRKNDVRVTARDKATAIKACAAALEAMRVSA